MLNIQLKLFVCGPIKKSKKAIANKLLAVEILQRNNLSVFFAPKNYSQYFDLL